MPALIFLAFLVTLNIWATRRVLRSDEFANRKSLLIAGIWIIPFMGALIAKNQIPIQSSTRSDSGATSEQLPVGFLRDAAPEVISMSDTQSFNVVEHIGTINGIPLMNWKACSDWVASLPDHEARLTAENLAHRAWLLHFRDALGSHFNLYESEQDYVLSSTESSIVVATARYVATTRERVGRVLKGVANFPTGQKSILLILDDDESYYHYVSTYYPDDGEFAFSGGMFVNFGCPHFVAKRADLSAIEPVIAHEMTHSALSYLKLPTWLDEGIAVNTERKLVGAPRLLYTPIELRDKHQRFWSEERIQEFWSGKSFHRTDDGNLLSYELARIMVEQMGRDWSSFSSFVTAAKRDDAGASAARDSLSIDLGAFVCALLEHEPTKNWSPAAQVEAPA